MERELARMAALCSRREYSEKDVLDKLLRRKVTPEDAAKILQALREGGYLSQKRYARAFARDKASLSGWGAAKITYHLKAKGVAAEDIKEALSEIDPQLGEQRLRQLLFLKWKQLSKEEDCQKKVMKTIRYAMGRGYDYEQIKELLKELK